MYFFSMTLLPILRRIQRPTTQGNSSHVKYDENNAAAILAFAALSPHASSR